MIPRKMILVTGLAAAGIGGAIAGLAVLNFTHSGLTDSLASQHLSILTVLMAALLLFVSQVLLPLRLPWYQP